ncbi:MAG: T9SS type A sorting domain-containing protein [Bacteroidales bacterium]|nr:T9SS type A sorting domain-containing protein [Bacteroidales bacterium]
MKTKIFTFLLMFIALGINAQTISIDSARTLGIGATVTVKGIITNGDELGGIRYFQDTTAGIAAYSSSMSGVLRGDSILITGTIKDYNELMEIDPVSSFTVLSSSNTLPAPVLVTPLQIDETKEGQLVKVDNAIFTTSPGGTFASNSSYNFTANGETSKIYVRSNHPLIGQTIPSGPVNLIGIATQHSYSGPNTGYQLLLRDMNDIIITSSIWLTSPLLHYQGTDTWVAFKWSTNTNGTTEAFFGSTPNLGSHLPNMFSPDTIHSLQIPNLNPSEVVYVRAFSVAGSDTAFSPIRTFITTSNSSGKIISYFNQDIDASVKTHKLAMNIGTAIDDTLIAYIDRAQSTIDFTMYNFVENNMSSVSGALNAAYNRGVVVRVIFDGSANNTGIQSLLPAIKKIGSPTGSEYGLMHNKFIIFDANDVMNSYLWTGSTNLTDGQVNLDPNSVIITQDKSLAIAYTLEFDEMFGSTTATPSLTNAKFGPYKMDNTPHLFDIGGRKVECYFSPSDGTNNYILSTIDSASANMSIGTMLITRSDIAYAIDDAVTQRSVSTRILVNSEGQCSQTVWGLLKTLLGDDMVEDNLAPGIWHHKFMIADEGTNSDPTLLVGCHNWSNAANNKNDENTLIIYDDTLANVYYQAFKQRFDVNYVSIDVNDFASLVKLYPNPSNGQFSVEIETENSFTADVVVYDLTGRTVLSQQNGLHSGLNTLSINVDGVAPGTYVLQLRNNDKQYVATFIVK